MRSTLMTIVVLALLAIKALAAQIPHVPVEREAEIRKAVVEYVQLKTASLGCQVNVKRLIINGNHTFPPGALEYEVIAPQQWEGWGNAGISIIARQNDRVVRNIPARVEVEALADMVVTTRQLDRDTIITGSDLAVRKQDIAAVQGRYLASVDSAIGKKVRMTVRANTPLRSDQLEKIPLIKPGQLVTIVAENERMRITVTGKAKSAGAEGDTVVVQNLNSLKEIPARVLDANTVQIVF